jgi:hypothetical protein
VEPHEVADIQMFNPKEKKVAMVQPLQLFVATGVFSESKRGLQGLA